ncbi:diguanylate cyclase [Rhodobacterales bacterium]|nr:diguanylate cyclase [Rhodobacterales bacterium]
MAILRTQNEAKRLEALHALQIFHSERLPEYDAVVEALAVVFDCPISLITIVAEEEQWFKARYGLDVVATPRESSFCQHTIQSDDLLIVPDAHKDTRFRDSPLVVGAPHIRFYAGYPISIDGVHRLGSLCVIDRKPRRPTKQQLQQLRRFGMLVDGLIKSHRAQIEMQKAMRVADEERRAAERDRMLLEEVTNVSGVGGWDLDLETEVVIWTDKTREIHEVDPDHNPTLDRALSYYPDGAREVISAAVEKGMEDGHDWDVELPFVTAKGRDIWVRAAGRPVLRDGKVVRLVGAFQDVSERKAMETQLARSERLSRARMEELEAVLANMRQGVSVFDARGRLTLWNRNYVELFRKPEDEVREGVSLTELIEAEKARGEFEGDVKDYIMDLLIRLSAGEVVRAKFTHPDGRVISAVHAPLPCGGWIGTHEDVTVSEQAVQKIEYAATHDMLTGLANRAKFAAALDDALKTASNSDRASELLLLDLDRFKPINDTYGHDVGDELLKIVSMRLEESMRGSDLVARLGGDEFGVILTRRGNAQIDSYRVAERIIQRLGEPFSVLGHLVTIGVSIGIARIDGAAEDGAAVMKNADVALYDVKNNGRNGYRFHEAPMLLRRKYGG